MIIAMTAAGRSQAEIVEAINGSVRTVRRWQRDPSIVKDVVAAAGSGRFCESRLGRRRLCAPPQRRVPRCGYRVAVAAHAGAYGLCRSVKGSGEVRAQASGGSLAGRPGVATSLPPGATAG